MSDIDALRQRVEAAERSFGLIDERDRNYSARLINLISGIEGQLRQHQAELAERDARLGRQERENGELRAMLHSLLLAVEDGGKDRLGDTVNSMDQRVTDLLASEEVKAGLPIEGAESAAPVEPAAAVQETGPDAAASTAEETTDEVPDEFPDQAIADSNDTTFAAVEITVEPDEIAGEFGGPSRASGAVAQDAAEPSLQPSPDEAPTDTPETAPEPAVTAEAASDEGVDLEAADPPPARAKADNADVSAARPVAKGAGEPENAEDESLGEELLATLEDVIDDAPAGATGSEAAEDPIELEIEAESAPDQSEVPPEPAETTVEAPADDIAALDEILSGDQTTNPTTDLEAEQPTVGALEGTDVVMVGWEADDAADQVAEAADPELAERAEKIAALLSSGDESDPSVKEIIEKVTELAASLAAEPGDTVGDVDPTAETLVEAIAAPDPAAEAAPQATSAA